MALRKNFKSKRCLFFTLTVSLVIATAFFICSSRGDNVLVVDIHDNPIVNAEVSAISLSMNGAPNLTNSKGIARIPHMIQPTEWISIQKEGYNEERIDFVKPWPQKPVKVVLEKGNLSYAERFINF